ncbi:MAG: hypothetical protein F7C07_06480 [Desulfurococcales archaeon]|nr:hypothetical protein [Desulfurococcales archaeon]
MEPENKGETIRSVGIAGALLLALGILFMAGTIELTQAQPPTYIYVIGGIQFNVTIFTLADNGTTVTGTIGDITEVNITVVFPTGVTGSVNVSIASSPLTPAQVVSLGATDPSTAFTGREQAFLLTDLKVDHLAVSGGTPVTNVSFSVPSPDARAYFWNDTANEWQAFPNQTIESIPGGFALVLSIHQELLGTPFVVTVPAPPPAVGGILDLETSAGRAGLAMVIIGVALIVASLVAYKKFGRIQPSMTTATSQAA